MVKGDVVFDNLNSAYEVVIVGKSEIVLQAGDPTDPEFYVFESDEGIWRDANEPDIYLTLTLYA